MMKYVLEQLRELNSLNGNHKQPIIWLLVDAASVFVFFTGLCAMMGYFLHKPAMYSDWLWHLPSATSFQSAVCFTLIGFVLLVMHRRQA